MVIGGRWRLGWQEAEDRRVVCWRVDHDFTKERTKERVSDSVTMLVGAGNKGVAY